MLTGNIFHIEDFVAFDRFKIPPDSPLKTVINSIAKIANHRFLKDSSFRFLADNKHWIEIICARNLKYITETTAYEWEVTLGNKVAIRKPLNGEPEVIPEDQRIEKVLRKPWSCIIS